MTVYIDGDKLRTRRAKAGKTQAQLAAATGVTGPAVAGWEKPGPHRLAQDRAIKVAEVLGCDLAELTVGQARRTRGADTPPPKTRLPLRKYNRTGTNVRYPGFLIQEYWLGPLGIDLKTAALVLGMPKPRLEEMLEGRVRVNVRVLQLLERHYGIDARAILAIQTQAELVNEERYEDE